MVAGKTSTGFEFVVNERIIRDVDLLDAFTLTKSSDIADQTVGTREVGEILLGKKRYDELKAHIREKDIDGIAGIDNIAKEIVEIISVIADENKKIKNL